jgi:predicted aldo/keto reductase-like oxidoreductase
MKKLIIAVMLVAFAFTLAYAADTVTYESKKGNVTFNHKAHSDKIDCAVCHEGTPAKIAIDKKAAHGDACKACHKKDGGPTKCNDCHKK